MKMISILKGMLISIVSLTMVAAAAAQQVVKEIQSVRFLVLEVTPKGEATVSGQPVVLRLSPHYGKISKQGLDFRFKNETQELSLVTYIEKGYDIKRGDIIGFQVSQHIKLSPGSRVARHLPSGKAELVP